MNREQQKIIETAGYAIQGVPGLHLQPWEIYFSRNRNTGRIVEHRLPADPYSLKHYLAKGFVTDPKYLPEPKSVEKAVEGTVGTQEGLFVCEDCGKGFSKRIALTGHRRSHKITVGGN